MPYSDPLQQKVAANLRPLCPSELAVEKIREAKALLRSPNTFAAPVPGCVPVKAARGRCDNWMTCPYGSYAGENGIPEAEGCLEMAVKLSWNGWKSGAGCAIEPADNRIRVDMTGVKIVDGRISAPCPQCNRLRKMLKRHYEAGRGLRPCQTCSNQNKRGKRRKKSATSPTKVGRLATALK